MDEHEIDEYGESASVSLKFLTISAEAESADLPSLTSFHLISPMLTTPALATLAKGMNLLSRAFVVGCSPRRRGTSEDRPTAMEHEATVAAT